VHSLREILDAIFYSAADVLGAYSPMTSLQQEDHPPLLQNLTNRRYLERLHSALRKRVGRDPQPSAGIVDSQSVKSTGVGESSEAFIYVAMSRMMARRLACS